MGFDVITGNYAANKALKILRGGGSVGYEENGAVVLDTELSGGSFYGAPKTELEAGKTYTITLDSGVYSAKCLSTGESLYFGNAGLLGGDDTGESYVVLQAAMEDTIVFRVVDQNGGTHAKIVGEKTLHTIDPKYLPGVCLPVVEITSANYPSDGDAVYLTEDESAMLNSAVTKSNTIIVRIKDVFNGFPVTLPFVMDVTAAATEGISVLILVDNTKKISIFRANDEWIMGG